MEVTEKDLEKIKKDVMLRMKRVEGQVRGIQRMIEEGKECDEILVQVRAARSALKSANGIILKRYLLKCYATHQEEDAGEAIDEKMIKVLTSFMDG